jgi:hypothetical protein
MTKARNHVHARSYWGEFDAVPLMEWLNSKLRPASDPVERLLKFDQQLPIETTAQQLSSYLAKLVRKSKLAVAPVLVSAAPGRWQVDWRLVGHMHPSQGLALVKLLHLADRGLIDRVRKCAKKSCGRWFYAKFRHQRFHSERCQQETFKGDPNWKKQRAEYMKRLRAEQKLRERRMWPRELKGKGGR